MHSDHWSPYDCACNSISSSWLYSQGGRWKWGQWATNSGRCLLPDISGRNSYLWDWQKLLHTLLGVEDDLLTDFGQVTETPSGSFQFVSAGGTHTCALQNGLIECWGVSDEGNIDYGQVSDAPADKYGCSWELTGIHEGSPFGVWSLAE